MHGIIDGQKLQSAVHNDHPLTDQFFGLWVKKKLLSKIELRFIVQRIAKLLNAESRVSRKVQTDNYDSVVWTRRTFVNRLFCKRILST